jgi:hypothetical protein
MNVPQKRLESALQAALRDARVLAGHAEPDGVVVLDVLTEEGGHHSMRAMWAGEGWPADVHAVADSIPDPWPRDHVVAARRLSPGSLEFLRERDANWADESGQARIKAAGLLVLREPAPERGPAPGFAWSPSALAVGEALLTGDWPDGIRTTDIATTAGWSPPQVSQVLSAFDDRGWTLKVGPSRGPGARRELADAEGLLGEWADAIARQEPEIRLVHRVVRAPMRFLREELAPTLDANVRWALTGWAAADVLAPLVSQVPSLQIYVHTDDFVGPLDTVIESLGLADVSEGAAIELREAPPFALGASSTRNGLTLASGPRVYADLLAMGGRGEDAAAHLKEEVIDPVLRPRGKHAVPPGLARWQRECEHRLQDLVEEASGADYAERYRHGTWSAAYQLVGVAEEPSLQKLLPLLREAVSQETSWPPWWVPNRPELRPRPYDDIIECWIAGTFFADPAHSDFWRADPRGRLCLIRGYDEDSEPQEIPPGTELELTSPIWRVGECLLHAERLGSRLGAGNVQIMMRWKGLSGRTLRARGIENYAPPIVDHGCAQDEVSTFVRAKVADVTENLNELVRELVEPLFAVFDFFQLPDDIYAQELDKMRARDNA